MSGSEGGWRCPECGVLLEEFAEGLYQCRGCKWVFNRGHLERVRGRWREEEGDEREADGE